MSEPCILRQGIFGHWFIFHPENRFRAWSGIRWVECSSDGLATHTQVCNFETEEEARDACREYGLEPLEV